MTSWLDWSNRPVVYRCYSADGRLIYVGSTYQLEQRMKAHLRGTQCSFWAPMFRKLHVTLCATDEEARELEKQVIRDEAPRFNIRHQRPFDEMTREQIEDCITAYASTGLSYNRSITIPYLRRIIRSRFPQAVTA